LDHFSQDVGLAANQEILTTCADVCDVFPVAIYLFIILDLVMNKNKTQQQLVEDYDTRKSHNRLDEVLKEKALKQPYRGAGTETQTS